ncbi:putative transcriptional regulator, Crp/Fnr family [Clostridium sp. DL-VIII]|uniref:Crp/Fnr family transcriptional regulator n=1 Tax=Clostridium sp. DL-VIII TaxID=641107 RepID=UPI00023AFFEA|nr:Crp/Fnr family transcriptional regulator [Clostridium sp. DL-VIII]EHJ00381.1 putative transcriptional regulator, Crp/Fnr family [Clostridium sp. DL-VIII]
MFDKPSDYLELGLNLSFGEDLKNILNSTATVKRVLKDTNVLIQGEIPSSLYYVHQGIMRGYYIDSLGNDVTKCFASEREFACSEGLRKPGEASFSVESLEESICVIIPYSSIIEGVKKGTEMTAIINKYSQKALADAERHTRGLLTKSALDRYIEFKSEYSVIEDRISQAHIASYIGIRASSLSRIKRSMKIE